jgi:hypothetical protein
MTAVEAPMNAADAMTIELKETFIAQTRELFVDDGDFEILGAPSQTPVDAEQAELLSYKAAKSFVRRRHPLYVRSL